MHAFSKHFVATLAFAPLLASASAWGQTPPPSATAQDAPPLPAPATPAPAPLPAPDQAPAPVAPAPPVVAPTAAPPPADSDMSTFSSEAPRDERATDTEAERDGHAGFVAAFSIGYAAPSGASSGVAGDDASKLTGGQVPVTFEVGGNVTPSFFLGAYGAIAPGGVGSEVDASCTTNNFDCSSLSVHAGLAVRYRFMPGRPIEPWLGYGIGYESNTVTQSTNGLKATAALTGWELARFSFGLDFLADRMVAIGPFVEAALGQYQSYEFTAPTTNKSGSIENTAMHQWFTIGVKATFMP